MRTSLTWFAAIAIWLAACAGAHAASIVPTWRSATTLGTGVAELGNSVSDRSTVVTGWRGADGSVNVTTWTADDAGGAPVTTRLADSGSTPHVAPPSPGTGFAAWWTEPGPAAGQRTLRWSFGGPQWTAPTTAGPPSSEPFQVVGHGDAVVAVVEPTSGDRQIDVTLRFGTTRRLTTAAIVGTPAVARDPYGGPVHVLWRQHRAGATDILAGRHGLGTSALAPVLRDRVPDDLAGDPVAAADALAAAWPSTRDDDGHQQIKLSMNGLGDAGGEEFTFTSPGANVAAIHQVSLVGGGAGVAWSTADPAPNARHHMMFASRGEVTDPFREDELLAVGGAPPPVTAGRRGMQLGWAAGQADSPLNVAYRIFGSPGWRLRSLPGSGSVASLRFANPDLGDSDQGVAFDREETAGVHRLFLTAIPLNEPGLIDPLDLSGPVGSLRYDVRDVASLMSADSAYVHPLVAWQAAGTPLMGSHLTLGGAPVTTTVADEAADQITVLRTEQLGGVALWRSGSSLRASLFRAPPAATAPEQPPAGPGPDPGPPPTPPPPPAPIVPAIPIATPSLPRPVAATAPSLTVRPVARGRIRATLRCPASAPAPCRARLRWTARLPRRAERSVLARTGMMTIAPGRTLTRTLRPVRAAAGARRVRTRLDALDAGGATTARRHLTVSRLR